MTECRMRGGGSVCEREQPPNNGPTTALALIFLVLPPPQDGVHGPMSVLSARLPRYAYVSPDSAARHAKATENGLYNLLPGEIFWKNRYSFLLDRGYALRPRYHPDWRPSWIGTNRDPMFCEDSITLNVCLSFDCSSAKAPLTNFSVSDSD